MSGQPQNMERGVPGGIVELDIFFYQYNGGPLIDSDGYLTVGTMPRVQIVNPAGTVVADTNNQGETQAVRKSIGAYVYSYTIPTDATISDKWQIRWFITIDGNALYFTEYFRVVEAGSAGFDQQDYRVGFGFNNPDLTSDRVVEGQTVRGWGNLVTPDEMRYIVLFGTKLVSPDASQTYDDNMLQYYIDNSLAMIERDLNIDIYPRTVKHEDPIDTITGARTARTDIPAADQDNGEILVREPGYPYRPENARHYLYMKLRRRPLRSVEKAVMVDPVQNTMIDLYPWRREFPGFESYLQFFPNISVVGNYPFIPSKLLAAQYPFSDFPSAYYLDYKTGYVNAKFVPMEFRDILRWTAGILLLEDFGDGKAPGIASASASLNSVSESYSTTQSATNALYGARIEYYKWHIREWMKRNREKYTRNLIGVL